MPAPGVTVVFMVTVGTEVCHKLRSWRFEEIHGFTVLDLVGKLLPALHSDHFSLMFAAGKAQRKKPRSASP